MRFVITAMTEEHAVAISRWRNIPPYDLYDWPDWEKMLADGYEFADPQLRRSQYASVLLGKDELAGFVQFFPLSGVTRLGLGLRPDLCGRGLGPDFVRAIVEEALLSAPQNQIDLEVLVWNKRARKAYERAGFTVTDTYERNTPTGMARFHCMVYTPSSIVPEAGGPKRS